MTTSGHCVATPQLTHAIRLCCWRYWSVDGARWRPGLLARWLPALPLALRVAVPWVPAINCSLRGVRVGGVAQFILAAATDSRIVKFYLVVGPTSFENPLTDVPRCSSCSGSNRSPSWFRSKAPAKRRNGGNRSRTCATDHVCQGARLRGWARRRPLNEALGAGERPSGPGVFRPISDEGPAGLGRTGFTSSWKASHRRDVFWSKEKRSLPELLGNVGRPPACRQNRYAYLQVAGTQGDFAIRAGDEHSSAFRPGGEVAGNYDYEFRWLTPTGRPSGISPPTFPLGPRGGRLACRATGRRIVGRRDGGLEIIGEAQEIGILATAAQNALDHARPALTDLGRAMSASESPIEVTSGPLAAIR